MGNLKFKNKIKNRKENKTLARFKRYIKQSRRGITLFFCRREGRVLSYKSVQIMTKFKIIQKKNPILFRIIFQNRSNFSIKWKS